MFNPVEGGRIDIGWVARAADQCTFSQVVRLYDISPQLAIPTMLDRIQGVLRYAITVGQEATSCILNVEDEAYIGAVTGCAFGVMRYPKGEYPETFTGAIHPSGTRLDEVARALNWQRIAPPFPVGMMDVETSEEILADSHVFQEGETWDRSVFGKTVTRIGARYHLEKHCPACRDRGGGKRRQALSRGHPFPQRGHRGRDVRARVPRWIPDARRARVR